jgi:hypothetical protein
MYIYSAFGLSEIITGHQICLAQQPRTYSHTGGWIVPKLILTNEIELRR